MNKQFNLQGSLNPHRVLSCDYNKDLSLGVQSLIVPTASNGFITSIAGVIFGIVAHSVLSSLVSIGYLSSSTLIVWELVNILAIFLFVHVIPYWGTGYLIGWWFGLILMYQAKLMGFLEFGIYSLFLTFVMARRLLRRVTD